jgi:hypothetical protein
MESSLMNDDELDEFIDNINASTLDDSDLSDLPDASIDSDGEDHHRPDAISLEPAWLSIKNKV